MDEIGRCYVCFTRLKERTSADTKADLELTSMIKPFVTFSWNSSWRSTGWSKSLCAPDDYNTQSYKLMFKLSPASLQNLRDTRLTLTPSVIPNSKYVIMVIENFKNIFAFLLCCNHQVDREFFYHPVYEICRRVSSFVKIGSEADMFCLQMPVGSFQHFTNFYAT
jgi:hypothetical protein